MSEAPVARLRAAIQATRQLLLRYDDRYVVERLSEIDRRLSLGDASAIQSALSESSGSMGSLRDRFLSRTNGDPITPLDEFDANIRLTALVDEVRTAARAALHA